MSTPEALRDAGMAQAEQAADPRVILAIDAEIAKANAAGERWSANTIRERLPVSSRGLVGSRVKAASQRRPREMVAIDREPSTLSSTHKAEIKVWIGAQWLQTLGELAS